MTKSVSLETARKLKEAGFPQDTYLQFYKMGNTHVVWNPFEGKVAQDKDYPKIAAPLADEILDALPFMIMIDNTPRFLYIWKDDQGLYRVYYGSSADMTGLPDYQIDKEKPLTEAAANMYLWLVKNGFIKPKN